MNFLTQMALPATAWMALAWFLVGLLLGQRAKNAAAASRRSGKRRPSSSRDNGKRRSRGSVELYVGNLPYSTDEKELTRSFERYGNVVDVRIIRNGSNGRSKGYGFVTMRDEADSKAAIKNLHGSVIENREIVVNAAKSKDRRD